MVAHLVVDALVCTQLAQADVPATTHLTPEQRTKLFAAMLALTVMGLLLISLAWWAARWLRRNLGDRRPAAFSAERRRPGVRADDWASKPLHSPDELSSDVDS